MDRKFSLLQIGVTRRKPGVKRWNIRWFVAKFSDDQDGWQFTEKRCKQLLCACSKTLPGYLPNHFRVRLCVCGENISPVMKLISRSISAVAADWLRSMPVRSIACSLYWSIDKWINLGKSISLFFLPTIYSKIIFRFYHLTFIYITMASQSWL